MKVIIDNVKAIANAIAVRMVNRDNANWLKKELEEAGYTQVSVGEPKDGLSGSNIYHVIFGTKPGETETDTMAFLQKHPFLDIRK